MRETAWNYFKDAAAAGIVLGLVKGGGFAFGGTMRPETHSMLRW